jgi:microcystin-dependent protein
MSTSLLSQIRLSQNKQDVGKIRALSSYAVQPYEMLCWGAELNRADYPELFTFIGTTFGAGDGVTTFNLPDLRGTVIAGVDIMGGFPAGRLTNYGLGNSGINGDILGSVGGVDRKFLDLNNIPNGLLSLNSAAGNDTGLTTGTGGSELYQTSNPQVPVPNVQPTITMNYVINLGRNVVGSVPTPAPGFATTDEEFNGPFIDWVNVVTDYGADPTGLTDSTSAFQTMINDIWSRKTIGNPVYPNNYYQVTAGYVPSGTYLISETLWWPGQGLGYIDTHTFSIYGQDPSTTILKWTGPAYTPMLWFSNGDGSSFNRLTFDGQSVAGCEGIRFELSQSTPNYGQSGDESRIQDCIFKDLKYGIRRSEVANGGYFRDISIFRNSFYRCSSYGIYLQDNYQTTGNWWVRQCYFEQCYIGVGGQPTGPDINFSDINADGYISATATYLVVQASVAAGGSGYNQNDVLTVVGGTGTSATVTVSQVDQNGSVTQVNILSGGNYSALPTLSGVATTVSPAGGTSCTLNLSMGINTITAQSAGNNFSVAPYVQIQSNTGVGADATASISNGHITGITMNNHGYNYADVNVAIIRDPASGEFSVYDCIFNGSIYFDIYLAGGSNCGIRRNFSINSGRFLLSGGGQLSIVGNRVVNSINTDCFQHISQFANKSRIIFANNQIKSKTGAVGSIWLDLYNVTYDYQSGGLDGAVFWNRDLNNPPFVAWNNSFSVNYPGVFSFDSRYSNRLLWNTLTNQNVSVSVPLRPGTPQYMARQTFLIDQMSTAQQTIDAAVAYANSNPGSEPVVYMPCWANIYGGSKSLNLQVIPLIFPANVKMSFQGASGVSVVGWSDGLAVDYANVPEILFRGPSKVTVKNIAWDGFNQVDDNDRGGKHGMRVIFDNISQTGSRVIVDNCRLMPRSYENIDAQIQFTDLTYRNFGDPYAGDPDNTQPPISFSGNVLATGNGFVLIEGLSQGYSSPRFAYPNITIGDGSTVFVRDGWHAAGYGQPIYPFFNFTGNTSIGGNWFSCESISIVPPFDYNANQNGHYAHDITSMYSQDYAGNVIIASSDIRGRMNIQGDSSHFDIMSFGGSIFVVDDNNIFSIYNSQPISILGRVDDKTALPGWPNSYSGNLNDAYYTQDLGHLWVWDGSLWQDVVGLIGAIDTASHLPGYPNSYSGAINDAYVTKDTHRMWIWTGSTWQDLGGNVSMPSNYYFIDMGQHSTNHNISFPNTTPPAPLGPYWYDGAPSGNGGVLPSNYQTRATRLASVHPVVYINTLPDNVGDIRLQRVSGDITFYGNTYVY